MSVVCTPLGLTRASIDLLRVNGRFLDRYVYGLNIHWHEQSEDDCQQLHVFSIHWHGQSHQGASSVCLWSEHPLI